MSWLSEVDVLIKFTMFSKSDPKGEIDYVAGLANLLQIYFSLFMSYMTDVQDLIKIKCTKFITRSLEVKVTQSHGHIMKNCHFCTYSATY